MFEYLYEQYPWLTWALGASGVGIYAYSKYVKLTKTKEDDKAWEELKNHKIWGKVINLISKQSAKPTDKKK